jgi:Predicted Fe-S oxidoreductases
MPIFFIRFRQLLNFVRYLSFRKVANYILLQFDCCLSYYKKQLSKRRYPFFISVEPANFCNLHCPECPVGKRQNSQFAKHRMEFDLFKKLIDELKPTLLHTIFYFQGEPLLSRQLSEMIQYAHDAKIYTSTSTNAQLLNKEMAERLIRSGLDKLIISIDGSTQETYETYRVGGNLQRAIEGAKQLAELKKQLNAVNPFVEIQCLLLSSNEHQIQEMKKLAKELGADKLTFKTAQFYNFENGNELMPNNSKHSRYKKDKNGKYTLKKPLKNRCKRLWTGAVVTTEGNVLPCCFDKDHSFSFGNFNENSFVECWHSEKALRFRKNILTNRKQFEMCRNCTS